MCSVLVRERPGGVGHCLATTRDENGCVRVSASAVEDLDDLELPRDPYKYKAKQPDPLRRGFRFSACNSKKTYCLFREKPPQVPQSPTAQVQSNASFSCPIAA